MKHHQTSRFWHSAAPSVVGSIAVALLTFVCFRLDVDPVTAAFLYLIVIVLVSLRGNFVPSAVVSFIAICCLDYFFTPPLFRVRLSQPLDVMALMTFWTTALVITRLRSKVRKSFQDIQALQDQQRLVIDTIPALVWTALPDGSRDFLNQRWLEYTGLSSEEGLGWTWQAAFHPDDLSGYDAKWRAAAASGAPFEHEVRMRRADGAYRWFLISGVLLRDQLGTIVKWYGTSTEIEDRKQAEEALREQASLLNLTHDTVFVRNMNDVITYWNRGAEELYGWTRDEAVGKVTHQLTQTIFPAPLAEINTELLRTGRWEGELVHTKRDGTPVVVASRWALQRDEQGRPAAILETNNDSTERKRAEDALRKAQTELAHVTRVMTVGELAASIAHEVNQPLTGVITNGNACLRWLGRTPPDVDEAREAVRRMIRDGSRASEVMARIRTLLRKAEPQKTRLAINDVIGEVIALAESEVHRNRVLLKTDLAADFPPVLADRIQLQQVLLNLMLNGMEAMRAVTDRSRELIIRSQAEETDAIRVGVQDAGVGIDPQDMDRIFTAFFTTKPEGLGMGLAISRSIIEAHGGRLWATPNAGPGATFQFTLPPHRESAS
jgi:two-component system, LuxR family, sensor kinase FixL